MKSSEDDEGLGQTGAITESLTNIYSILMGHINIAIDTFTLYSATSNRLTGIISTLNILAWHCRMNKFL